MQDNPTGLECPDCHQTSHFTADRVILTGRVQIDPDGWDWTLGKNYDAELPDSATVTCDGCGLEFPLPEGIPGVLRPARTSQRPHRLPAECRIERERGDIITAEDRTGERVDLRLGYGHAVIRTEEDIILRFLVPAAVTDGTFALGLADEEGTCHDLAHARWAEWTDRPAPDRIRLEHRHAAIQADLPRSRTTFLPDMGAWRGPDGTIWDTDDWTDPDAPADI